MISNLKILSIYMKLILFFSGVFFLLLTLNQCTDRNERTEVSIFNGRDLTGWESSDMDYWRVMDSAIVGGKGTEKIPNNQFLWNKTKVKDFYLAIEVKMEPNTANAGIQFRSVKHGAEAKGYQADAGQGNWGRLYHELGRGKLDWRGEGESAIRPGQWNTYEILVIGHHIWTAINGKLSVSYFDPEGELEGYIALQIHSGAAQTVRYRPLKLIHNPKVELAGFNEDQLMESLKSPSLARLNENPTKIVYPPFDDGEFDIKDGEVIALIGQTNMLREQYYAELETRLVLEGPEKKIQCRNLAWDGDTVYEQWRDLNFGSWKSQLNWIDASMVIAQFGQTESMDGIEKIPEFIKEYEKLLDQFATKTQRIVLVSPMPFEPPSDSIHRDLTTLNKSVSVYAKAIGDLARRRGYVFVDLYNAFQKGEEKRGLTDNGMHLNAKGVEVIGRTISNLLLSKETSNLLDFQALQKEIIEKNRIWFEALRPVNWAFAYGDRTSQPFGHSVAKEEPSLEDELMNFVSILTQMDDRVQNIALNKEPKELILPYHNRKTNKAALTPEEEMDSFTVREGLEVNLFASEADGIINPVKMSWDEKGRLWVACSPTYPQKVPGKMPKDYILICEDRDNDGRADKFTRFAEGLFLPFGIEFGDGGVYVCEGPNLIHMRDTDGDDKADSQRIVLSGFNIGDSHQSINSISWGPSGELWFTQGHHIYSRVETPFGIKSLDKAGLWRYRPKKDLLEGFFNNSTAGANIWGANHDDWGQIFHNSGANKAYYTVPGMIPTSNPLEYKYVSPLFNSRIKTIGFEFIGTQHMPSNLQGTVITSGYLANNVELFHLIEDGSGFKSKPLKNPLLISSSRKEFRVVDIKMGPDGAIYLCDWFNPIIGHYQYSYSDPDRDYNHGRIWRITARNRPIVQRTDLINMTASELLDQLHSKERWVRYQAKRLLFNKPTKMVIRAADTWVSRLNPQGPDYEQLLYRVIGVYEAHESVNAKVLDKMLSAKSYHVRAYAARVIGHVSDKLQNPLELLEKCIMDTHPRVRLEAVVSCSQLSSADALGVAMKALAKADKFIEYSLTQTVHALAPYWKPAFLSNKLDFSNDLDQILFVLKIDKSPMMLDTIRQLTKNREIAENNRKQLLQLLVEMGNSEDLRFVFNTSRNIDILNALEQASLTREIRPSGNLERDIESLLQTNSPSPAEKVAAIRLASSWKINAMWDELLDYTAITNNQEVRIAAIECLEVLDNSKALPVLERILASEVDLNVIAATIRAMAKSQPESAAKHVVEILKTASGKKELVTKIVLPFLQFSFGSQILATKLKENTLPKEVQNNILELIASSGSNAPELNQIFLNDMEKVIGIPEYSPDLVDSLLAEVKNKGNAEKGKTVYKTKTVSCSACHMIDGLGSDIGPDLSSIGSSMPTKFIIESLIWPQKDIKEGFLSTTITTNGGTIVRGYVRKEDDNALTIFNLATKELVTVQLANVVDRQDAGSAMPMGVVASLGKQEFLDLVSYLERLRGQ